MKIKTQSSFVGQPLNEKLKINDCWKGESNFSRDESPERLTKPKWSTLKSFTYKQQ